MKSTKIIIIITLLSVTILASYSLPRAKYTGTGFISKLHIPVTVSDWQGRDITSESGINLQSDTYGFVSEARIHQYTNNNGKRLLFILLDAGNFHHPKACFTGAGYEIKELPDSEFNIENRTLKTHTLFTKKGTDSFLSFYWIIIDKDVAHEWVEQKTKQLFFSLFGKKRVGLMVRLDIPTTEANTEEAHMLASQFVNDLNQTLQPEQADYIYGEAPN